MAGHYILNSDHTTKVVSELKWANWMASNSRRVAHDTILGVEISTVFLGLDHNYSTVGAPVLFETLAFGLPEAGQLTARYCTWAEAVAGHEMMKESIVKKMETSEEVVKESNIIISQLKEVDAQYLSRKIQL